jgi:hypothetical protein
MVHSSTVFECNKGGVRPVRRVVSCGLFRSGSVWQAIGGFALVAGDDFAVFLLFAAGC